MILIATGLKREARLLAGPDAHVIAGGGDGERLRRELEAAAPSASAILSAGLCGALSPGLKPSDWIVAMEVIAADDGRHIATDKAWNIALMKALPGARAGLVLGSDVMIADAARKARAHDHTGAMAVDMESHIAGEVAAKHGLPFAVARVVSDAADRSLPKAAQAGMAADGGMDIRAVLLALARDPRQLPALVRVGGEADVAFNALKTFRARSSDLTLNIFSSNR